MELYVVGLLYILSMLEYEKKNESENLEEEIFQTYGDEPSFFWIDDTHLEITVRGSDTPTISKKEAKGVVIAYMTESDFNTEEKIKAKLKAIKENNKKTYSNDEKRLQEMDDYIDKKYSIFLQWVKNNTILHTFNP